VLVRFTGSRITKQSANRSGGSWRCFTKWIPDLGPFAMRLWEIFEIRNTAAHGIANYMHDRTMIPLEMRPIAKKEPYRILRLTRAQLVELGDEARRMAGDIQLTMGRQFENFADDDQEDVPAVAEGASGWLEDPDLLAKFPTVEPLRIYSMHIDDAGQYWGSPVRQPHREAKDGSSAPTVEMREPRLDHSQHKWLVKS
jgi:hypothetical protein